MNQSEKWRRDVVAHIASQLDFERLEQHPWLDEFQVGEFRQSIGGHYFYSTIVWPEAKYECGCTLALSIAAKDGEAVFLPSIDVDIVVDEYLRHGERVTNVVEHEIREHHARHEVEEDEAESCAVCSEPAMRAAGGGYALCEKHCPLCAVLEELWPIACRLPQARAKAMAWPLNPVHGTAVNPAPSSSDPR